MQATRLAGGGGGGGMNAQLPVHPPRRASSRGGEGRDQDARHGSSPSLLLCRQQTAVDLWLGCCHGFGGG